MSAIEETIIPIRLQAYAQKLLKLKLLQQKLGLSNESTAITTVISGTESDDRPLGAPLPIFIDSPTETGQGQSEKSLFNLLSLTDFKLEL